jgi:uncharacterized YigZ family protein
MMASVDTYRTIEAFSRGIYKEKGSRFIADAFPVSDVDEIRSLIEMKRKEYHDARHHCYAYMLGYERLLWRMNDDGEPSGTAGKPILGQINSFGLTNILIIVTRYFGGTLLGVSGLINAYRSAAAEALKSAVITERKVNVHYEISYPYISMNDVMRIIREEGIGIEKQIFEDKCRMSIYFRLSQKERILSRLMRIKEIDASYLETY